MTLSRFPVKLVAYGMWVGSSIDFGSVPRVPHGKNPESRDINSQNDSEKWDIDLEWPYCRPLNFPQLTIGREIFLPAAGPFPKRSAYNIGMYRSCTKIICFYSIPQSIPINLHKSWVYLDSILAEGLLYVHGRKAQFKH